MWVFFRTAGPTHASCSGSGRATFKEAPVGQVEVVGGIALGSLAWYPEVGPIHIEDALGRNPRTPGNLLQMSARHRRAGFSGPE